MKPIIGLAVLASLLPCGGLAGRQVPDSLTVEQAVERVLATHPAVREATGRVSASEARVDERRDAFSPTVTAEGFYSWTGPVTTLEFDDRSFSLFPSHNYHADVALTHTLYDGGRRETVVEQARSSRTTAAENVDLVKSRLAFLTVDAFYGVIFLEENLRVQDEEIEALDRHLEVVQGRIRAGTATDFEVLTTQVRIATAESRRVDMANALDERGIELRQLLGLAPGESVQPVGGFGGGPGQVDVDSLVAVALEQRPDVKMSRSAEASAEVETRLASLADRPSLSLSVALGARNGYQPNLTQIKPNWVAGMAVRVPVYNGDRTASQVRESEADASAARSHTEALERSVAAEVEKAVAAVRASRDKIRAADLQVRQATAALDLARTRYQAGVITNLDVLDAETLLSQAKLVRLRAGYDLVRSRYRLEQAVGDRIW